MKLTKELGAFIKDHEGDDIRTLALQKDKYPTIDITLAIRQIAGRKIARDKIPDWYRVEDIIYPQSISMEQCSSQYTAKYKASLCSGRSMIDLTGGLGVDFSFLAANFKQATYVEQQSELAQIADHNFAVLGINQATVVVGDAQSSLENTDPVDLIYIDPARRSDSGKKTVLIEDCTPNIIDIETLLEEKANKVMIKLSPMLDISLALKSLKNVSDIHIVSHNNECKELIFVKMREALNPLLHCVNIVNERVDTFTFYKKEEEILSVQYAHQLGKYLYEPNSAILKAGAFKSIAQHFDLNKLHLNSHLYTSNDSHPEFHGRKFEIITSFSLNKKEVKDNLKDIKQANITVRNFPLSVDDLRKRLSLKDGGDLYLFATTLLDEKKVLILCKKV